MTDRIQEVRNLALACGYQPYTVVEQIDPTQEGGKFREVELISWPYPSEDDPEKVLIMARIVVGDPTSIEAVDVKTLGDVLYRT